MPIGERDLDATRTTLARWLATKLPSATDVRVPVLDAPTDGVSNETLIFDATWNEDGRPRSESLVARLQPDANQIFLGMDVFFQWQMMDALAQHSTVPVPQVRWKESDRSILGCPFFVMSKLDGFVPNRFISPAMRDLTPEARRTVYVNGLAAMAQVHQLDWHDGFAFLDNGGPGQVGLDRYLHWVEDWYEWARQGRSVGEIEQGLRYLREHQPSEPPVTLQWGDSRPGNIMYGHEHQQVVGVLDWELAALGVPEADLGWWLMFEVVLAAEVGNEKPEGSLERDETLTTYERFLGRSLGDVHYFDVLAWTRFGITMHRSVDLETGGPMEETYKMFDGFVRQQLAGVVAAG